MLVGHLELRAFEMGGMKMVGSGVRMTVIVVVTGCFWVTVVFWVLARRVRAETMRMLVKSMAVAGLRRIVCKRM